MRNYKENIRAKPEGLPPQGRVASARRIGQQLPPAAGRCAAGAPARGWRRLDGGAKKGAANKIGYIAAHSAIVLCAWAGCSTAT
jgi:hypothetical protein